MLLGILFLIGGIFRLGVGIAAKNPYRGWFILQGVVSLLLAIMILTEWPVSAVWVIGTFVAIDLLITGLRMISFGLAVKNLAPSGGDDERRTGPHRRRADCLSQIRHAGSVYCEPPTLFISRANW